MPAKYVAMLGSVGKIVDQASDRRLAGTALGKWHPDEQGLQTMPLVDHCADVAGVTEALLKLPTIRRRLELLAETTLRCSTVTRLTLLAFLHDVGKTSAGFQTKRLADDERWPLLRREGIRIDQCGHTHCVGYLMRSVSLPEGLEPIRDWGGVHWLAALSHHGTPIRYDDLSQDKYASAVRLWQPLAGYDPEKALADLAAAGRRWFPQAFAETTEPLPDAPAFVHAFSGLVSLADWIASNPAPGFFPYQTPTGSSDRLAFARERAALVLRRMCIDVEESRIDLRRRSVTFSDLFPFQPTLLQITMGDLSLGKVVAAEDETGAGKTEAALWRFKTLFEAGEVDSLAFVLPTRVAAVAIEKRVGDFIARLFPDPALRPNVVLAVPGYLRADGEDGQRLAEFKTLWPDQRDEASAHRRWAAESAKRYLAAAIAVGTIDQTLLSGLRIRHAHLRGAALLRSLLVVDEVHSSDAYMTRLLQGVLRRHQAAGGHALLLSATLGSATRDDLLGIRRPHGKIGRRSQPPDSAQAEMAAYPAVSDLYGLRPMGRPAGEGDRPNKPVTLDLQPLIDDPARIAAIALEAGNRGARVLVVRNTVGGVIAVQQALEDLAGPESPLLFRAAGVVCPHHGRYAAEDRRVLDAAIEDAFGKEARRDGGRVLAGSQTLEQSLDIDADFLITDLAPVDVLLQRIGRLHRHRDRHRPEGFAAASCLVLTPEERDLAPFLKARRGRSRHGMGSVYDNLLAIDVTWRELAGRGAVAIPRDNRVLVERATDRQQLYRHAEELGGGWPAHWQEISGNTAAERTAATYAALSWNDDWDAVTWPDLNEKIKTRLGLDDRLLDLSSAWTSPFGASLTQFKIPGWMTPKAPPDGPGEIVARSEAQLDVRWGDRVYAYTRMGLTV